MKNPYSIDLQSEKAKYILKAVSFILGEEIENVTSIEVRDFPSRNVYTCDIYCNNRLTISSDIKQNLKI